MVSVRLGCGIALLLAGLVAGREADPAEARPPAEAFAALSGMRSPDLSPDGRHVAYLADHRGRYQAALRNLDGERAKTVLIALGDSREEAVRVDWSGSRHLIVSALLPASRGGRAMARAYVFDVETRRATSIVPPPPRGGHSLRAKRMRRQLEAVVELVDPLRYDADVAIFRVGDPQDLRTDIRAIPLRGGSDRVVEHNAARMLRYETDHKGRVRIAFSGRDDRPNIYYRAPDSSSWSRLGPPFDADRGDEVLGIAPDGRSLLVLRPHGPRGGEILPYRPEETSFGSPILADAERPVTEALFDPATPSNRVIGYRYAGDFERDLYTDPAWAARQAAIDRLLPESVNHIVSSSHDSRRHIVEALSDRRPARFLLYDEDSGQLSLLAEDYPDLPRESLAASKPVSYPAADGAAVPALLTRPPQAPIGPLPAVLLVHGGPHSRVWRDFDYWRQFLASRGYLVLEPNFRGSSGFGQAWKTAGHLEWGGLMQDDVADGARWLVREGHADPARICIMGGSYGGYAALMGAAKTPDLYACAVSINGVSDLEFMVRDDRRTYDGAPWARFIGEGAASREARRRVSPVHLAADIRIPVLLVHAKDDRRVDIAHSERMQAALLDAGHTVGLVTLAGGGHGLATFAARLGMLDAVESFLTRHLARRESPAPVRPRPAPTKAGSAPAGVPYF